MNPGYASAYPELTRPVEALHFERAHTRLVVVGKGSDTTIIQCRLISFTGEIPTP